MLSKQIEELQSSCLEANMDSYYQNLEEKVRKIKKEDKQRTKGKEIKFIDNPLNRNSTYSQRTKLIILSFVEHEVETHAKFSVQIKHPKSHEITHTYVSDGFHQTRNTGETEGNVNIDSITVNLPSTPTQRHLEVTPTSFTATKDKDSC